MRKNDDGKWIITGAIARDVQVEISARDALDFFRLALVEQNGGWAGMRSMPDDKSAFFRTLSNIIMEGMGDVDAVKEANESLATTLKVGEFRTWLPELMREFGNYVREIEGEDRDDGYVAHTRPSHR